MNQTIGKPIAYGRTAEIYPWNDGQVLKLFFDWFDIENIEYEFRIARSVQESGLPVPAVGEVIHVNDRVGLTYQRVEGISMFEMISHRPWLMLHYANRLAELHVEMHSSNINADLPDQRQKLEHKINHADALSPDQKSNIISDLESMPGGNRLCHGDFHPGNIMVAGKDEVIIDWIDAAIGNPLADLARTTIISLGAMASDQFQKPVMKLAVRIFHSLYLRRYFSIRPGGESEYVDWLPIVAAARLSENIAELEDWLAAWVEDGDSLSG